MSHKNRDRRSLIKSVAVAGVVIEGVVQPGSWLKPVVETVVLPAHAATSAADEAANSSAEQTEILICGALIIPGFSENCGNDDSEQYAYYYVDASGECPALVKLADDSGAPGSANILVIGSETSGTGAEPPDDGGGDSFGEEDAEVYAWLGAYFSASGSEQQIEQQCGNGAYLPTQEAINQSFRASNGDTWNASGLLSRTRTSVTVSSITLTRS